MIERYHKVSEFLFSFSTTEDRILVFRQGGIWRGQVIIGRTWGFATVFDEEAETAKAAAFAAEKETARLSSELGKLCVEVNQGHWFVRVESAETEERYEAAYKDATIIVRRFAEYKTAWDAYIAFSSPLMGYDDLWHEARDTRRQAMEAAVERAAQMAIRIGKMAVDARG